MYNFSEPILETTYIDAVEVRVRAVRAASRGTYYARTGTAPQVRRTLLYTPSNPLAALPSPAPTLPTPQTLPSNRKNTLCILSDCPSYFFSYGEFPQHGWKR